MAKILLAEDDPVTLAVLRKHAESAQHEVISVANGTDALHRALQDPPDIVISDIMMPGFGGLELLKALRERSETVMVPVILITAAPEREIYRKGMRLGADDFLIKPIGRHDFLEAVSVRLERVKQLREAFVRASGGEIALSGPVSASAPPISVDGYRVVRKLGAGGMSLVYLAEHIATNTERVLKVVPISDSNEGDVVQRFIHEFALVSQIEHPNVARIFDQGFTDNHAYIAMEYFPGGDLRAMIGKGMPPELALAVVLQTANGLSAIHHQGVVHRDMKPDNVMVRADGTLAIADFGIAKQPEAQLSSTQHGEVFGTPYYLSPEQATSGSVDARSDLYSLGVMFYEMLTGKKPFTANDIESLLYLHLNAPIPSLPETLARYQGLLEKTMAKNPKDRFASADELVASCMELDTALS